MSDLEHKAAQLARLDKPLHDLVGLRYTIRNDVAPNYLAELDAYIGQLTVLRRMLWDELMEARERASGAARLAAAEAFYAGLEFGCVDCAASVTGRCLACTESQEVAS